MCTYGGAIRIWDCKDLMRKGGQWFGTSKSRKAIHTETEKQIFAGPSLTMKPREDFDQRGFAQFPCLLQLVHIKLQLKSMMTAHFLEQVLCELEQGQRFFLSLFFLKSNQFTITHIPKRHIMGGQTLLPFNIQS